MVSTDIHNLKTTAFSEKKSERVLHLISDSTGETAAKVMRACLVHFRNQPTQEYLWPFVRTPGQLAEAITGIHARPGFVLFTLVDEALRQRLEQECMALNVPFCSLLAPILNGLELFLGESRQLLPGRQHMMDENYFRRIEAVEFSIAHDDGHGLASLHTAQVVLLGVSRMSKTPTSMYLAYRGIRAANIPLMQELPLPEELEMLAARQEEMRPEKSLPLIVGLTQDAYNLVSIRRNRLQYLGETASMSYTEPARIADEVLWAKRLFQKNKWPIIDVTRRSVEETAALIIQMLQREYEVHDLIL